MNEQEANEAMTDALLELARKLFMFHYCPECGKILDRKRQSIWSHDHSLQIGYTMYSKCIFCGWSDVYHDVE